MMSFMKVGINSSQKFECGFQKANKLAGAYRLRCVPQCVNKQNTNSTAAGIAVEPNSSSQLETEVGVHAGGLKWCIAVR